MSFSYGIIQHGLIQDNRHLEQKTFSKYPTAFSYKHQSENDVVINHEISEYDGVPYEIINDNTIFQYPKMDGQLFSQLHSKFNIFEMRNGKYACSYGISDIVKCIRKYEKECAKYDIGGEKFIESQHNIEELIMKL